MKLNPNKAWIEYNPAPLQPSGRYRLVVLGTTVFRTAELWELQAEAESLFGENRELRTWNVDDAVVGDWVNVSSYQPPADQCKLCRQQMAPESGDVHGMCAALENALADLTPTFNRSNP